MDEKINDKPSTSVDNLPISDKEAYFAALRTWVHQAKISQNAMTYFPYYLMANYPQMFQTGITTTAPTTNQSFINNNNNNNVNNTLEVDGNGRRILLEQHDEQIIRNHGGYEFVIAPFWKRFLAECVDVAILLLIKLIITFTIVDLFDLDLGIEFDLEALKKSIEDDYTEFLSLSSDLLLLEVLTKIGVCIYEAMWTMTGHLYVGGATPGKILLGLRIVYVEAVVPLQQAGLNNGNTGRALLYPAENPGFKRALLRAIAKNILMALLFPMCFVMLFFKNNRTAYDVMTKTIVVEENHAPVLRRL